MVTQESTSEFDYTVREMVMIGRTPYKGAFDRDTATDHSIVDQAIERVDCQRLAHRRFNTLSGGEKQLILVAPALRWTRPLCRGPAQPMARGLGWGW